VSSSCGWSWATSLGANSNPHFQFGSDVFLLLRLTLEAAVSQGGLLACKQVAGACLPCARDVWELPGFRQPSPRHSPGSQVCRQGDSRPYKTNVNEGELSIWEGSSSAKQLKTHSSDTLCAFSICSCVYPPPQKKTTKGGKEKEKMEEQSKGLFPCHATNGSGCLIVAGRDTSTFCGCPVFALLHAAVFCYLELCFAQQI